MNSLFLLVPLGVLVVIGASLLLIWAFRSGQFEDLDEIGAKLPDGDPEIAPVPPRVVGDDSSRR